MCIAPICKFSVNSLGSKHFASLYCANSRVRGYHGPTDRLDETSLRLSTRMLGQITIKHDFYDKAESSYYHVYTVPTCFW